MSKRVEVLKKEERNIKARLKTAYKQEARTAPKQPVLPAKDKQSCMEEIKHALGKGGNPS